MKSLLDDSLNELKRSHADTARNLSSMSLIGLKRGVTKINIDSTSKSATLLKRLKMTVRPVSLIKFTLYLRKVRSY